MGSRNCSSFVHPFAERTVCFVSALPSLIGGFPSFALKCSDPGGGSLGEFDYAY